MEASASIIPDLPQVLNELACPFFVPQDQVAVSPPSSSRHPTGACTVKHSHTHPRSGLCPMPSDLLDGASDQCGGADVPDREQDPVGVGIPEIKLPPSLRKPPGAINEGKSGRVPRLRKTDPYRPRHQRSEWTAKRWLEPLARWAHATGKCCGIGSTAAAEVEGPEPAETGNDHAAGGGWRFS